MNKKFDEPNGLSDVAEFHSTFDLPVLDDPTIPSSERCDLRINLLQEELNELKDAIADNDLVEIADALSDLQYVLSGAVLEFGLSTKFKMLFDEVHRSNMSKVCKSLEEAQRTQKHYKNTKNTESFIKEKNGEYLVYRVGDEKVLKSVEYSPADLKSMV
tara:strand:+ start:52 stop:528 length:477 start_codon:yes stop_codon:yes gene_type:complete